MRFTPPPRPGGARPDGLERVERGAAARHRAHQPAQADAFARTQSAV